MKKEIKAWMTVHKDYPLELRYYGGSTLISTIKSDLLGHVSEKNAGNGTSINKDILLVPCTITYKLPTTT